LSQQKTDEDGFSAPAQPHPILVTLSSAVSGTLHPTCPHGGLWASCSLGVSPLSGVCRPLYLKWRLWSGHPSPASLTQFLSGFLHLLTLFSCWVAYFLPPLTRTKPCMTFSTASFVHCRLPTPGTRAWHTAAHMSASSFQGPHHHVLL
jgi:hypothetical protein